MSVWVVLAARTKVLSKVVMVPLRIKRVEKVVVRRNEAQVGKRFEEPCHGFGLEGLPISFCPLASPLPVLSVA